MAASTLERLFVAGGLLPIHPPVLLDPKDMPIALGRRCCSSGSSYGPLARRNDESGAWVSGHNGVENGSPITSAIGHERGRRLVQLLQQGLDMRGIVDVLVGQIKCHDLAGAGVNANMKLSPSAAMGRPVLFKQPFAGAAQFQSSAIDDQVKIAGLVSQGHLNRQS